MNKIDFSMIKRRDSSGDFEAVLAEIQLPSNHARVKTGTVLVLSTIAFEVLLSVKNVNVKSRVQANFE